MKLMVSGSRGLQSFIQARDILFKYISEAEVVIHGNCYNSPDMWADEIASNLEVVIDRYPAEWNKYGKKAGFLRNETMVNKCDMAIIIWDEKSKGAKHVIDLCKKKSIKHLVVTPSGRIY